MNELITFSNEKFGTVRTVKIENEVWFVGKDVASALGYTDINHCILDHVAEDDRVNSKTQGQNAPEFGQRGTWLINESGLYSLIFGSKLEGAKEFKHWVTSEVLQKIKSVAKQDNKSILFNIGDVDCFEENNTLWFRIADVAKCIDYSSPDNWNKWFDDDEIVFRQINGIQKPMKYMSESALYRILTKSNVPKARPFERWVTKEVIPSIRKNGGYSLSKYSEKELEVMDKANKVKSAELLERLISYTPIKTYKDILVSYATKELTGEFLLPLPKVAEKLYSATEIAGMLNISIQKLGKIANENNLKIPENGEWIWDRAKNGKQVENFKYNESGLNAIRKLVG